MGELALPESSRFLLPWPRGASSCALLHSWEGPQNKGASSLTRRAAGLKNARFGGAVRNGVGCRVADSGLENDNSSAGMDKVLRGACALSVKQEVLPKFISGQLLLV